VYCIAYCTPRTSARSLVGEVHTGAIVERLEQRKAGAQREDVGVSFENHRGELGLREAGCRLVVVVRGNGTQPAGF